MMHAHALALALLVLCVPHHTTIMSVSAVRLRAYHYRHHRAERDPHVRYYYHYDHHHHQRDSRIDANDEEEEHEDDRPRPRLRRLSSSSLRGLAFDLSGFGFDVDERDDEGGLMTVTDDILMSTSPSITSEPSASPDVSMEPFPSLLPFSSPFSLPDDTLDSGDDDGEGDGEGEGDGDSSSSSSGNGKQPRSATSNPGSSRQYPCKAGYALRKQYTDFPRYVYVCQKAQRVDARKTTARCPDGFFRRMDLCIRSVALCAFTPMADPSCTVDACDSAAGPDGEAKYRLIEHVASCLICPSGYLLYFDADVYRCYKRLVETPVCVHGKAFDSGVGKCL